MSCMSGAMADFVGRDLAAEVGDVVVSSGGDSFIRCSEPADVFLYASGSPLHDRLVLALPAFRKPYGISTYVPGKGVQAVTVLSRSACWASALARDIGMRLVRGDSPKLVLDRVADYECVGGILLVSGSRIIAGGELVLRMANGNSAGQPE